MRTTVLIPLHRSAPWRSLVEANIARLHEHCRIVVSDAHEHDDTLTQVRTRFGQLATVDTVGARDLAPGWVAHVNDLMARAETEFALWLPHDDEIGPEWVLEAERALDRRPDAAIACGRLASSSHSEPDLAVSLDPDPVLASRSRIRRLSRAIAHIERGDPALLGMLFRGVVRRELVPPMPERDEHGSWSDIFWALSLLTRGAAVPTTATYEKTWHGGSTVQRWTDARDDRERLRLDIDRTLADLPARTRAVVDWAARRRAPVQSGGER
jgi:hypothetical protein